MAVRAGYNLQGSIMKKLLAFLYFYTPAYALAALPDGVVPSLEQALVDVMTLGALGLSIWAALAGIGFMRHAVGLDDPLKDWKPNRKELAAMNRQAMWDNYHTLREEMADRRYDAISQDRHEDSLRAEGRLVFADTSDVDPWDGYTAEDDARDRAAAGLDSGMSPSLAEAFGRLDPDAQNPEPDTVYLAGGSLSYGDSQETDAWKAWAASDSTEDFDSAKWQAGQTKTIMVNGREVTYTPDDSADWNDGMDEELTPEARQRQEEKEREYANFVDLPAEDNDPDDPMLNDRGTERF
jgi:hypothetical protein